MTLTLWPTFQHLSYLTGSFSNRNCLAQAAAVPRGSYLLNSGAATAVGKLIIGVAKAKGVKTINLVRKPAMSLPHMREYNGSA